MIEQVVRSEVLNAVINITVLCDMMQSVVSQQRPAYIFGVEK